MTTVEEALSLKGNVLLHPAFVTPHGVPVFLRATVMRVVAGNLLLSAIFVGCVSIVVDDVKWRMACALAFAVSTVAFYHYLKLIKLREATGSRVDGSSWTLHGWLSSIDTLALPVAPPARGAAGHAPV